MCTNCWLVRLPSCTSCFQSGFLQITSVPIPSAPQQIDDATAGRVQGAVYAASALRRDPIELRRGEPVLVAQAALVCCALFVIELVEAFEGLAADQAWDKPGFVAGRRGQDSDARIQGRNPLL